MLLAARRSLADVGADATAKTAGTKSETETETETEVVDETPQKRNHSRSLMPSGASRMLLILAGQSLKRDSALWSEMPMSPSHKELRPRALNCFRVLRWPTIPQQPRSFSLSLLCSRQLHCPENRSTRTDSLRSACLSPSSLRSTAPTTPFASLARLRLRPRGCAHRIV